MAAIEGLTRIPELRRRLLFTLGLLAVYRMGCHIPAPWADKAALVKFMGTPTGGLLNVLNLFTGRAFEQASIFALGIMPYISSSIIFQLLGYVSPQLKAMQKESEQGRQRVNQYSRYATVLIAIAQGIGVHKVFISPAATQAQISVSIMTLVAGTMFVMWLGEQITDRGIGNGTSLIIFAGIVCGIPAAANQTIQMIKDGQLSPIVAILLAVFMVAVVAVIVFLETGHRRIPFQSAKRMVGRRLVGGASSYLPLKLNVAGVIPPIFANSLMTAPLVIASWLAVDNNNAVISALQSTLQRGGTLYYTMYVGLIVFFCFFYTEAVFNPNDVAENLKKYGNYIPGIRPGKNTADYIQGVLQRLTFGGAIYLALVCLLPDFLMTEFKVSFFFGGTTLLILVGVAIDTVEKIQTFLLHRDYEGFMKNAKLRGRRG